tara:strand:+ start:381 stop:968 length:588 start_codon:yes stop_codon:yes gene_type:complete
MTKSQFNIKISKDLLVRVKRQAMMSGKSLTQHITDLVTKSLSEKDFNNDAIKSTSKIRELESRLLSVESILRSREYLSKKLKPFTNTEAINCSKFMRASFEKEVLKRNFEDKNKAFDDFLDHLNLICNLSEKYTCRLKEIMIEDNPTPWSGKELNYVVGNDKFNCPIRKGLILWTGNFDYPSQQEICDKGEKLLT